MESTFLKKPSTEKITAVKWTGLNKEEIIDFCDESALVKVRSEIGEYYGISVPAHDGNVIAKPGDFIVKVKRHNKEVFEVWSEERLNESYFSTEDVNRAYLDIEKETVAEKLNKLNAYITNSSKKAPFKKLNPVEQGFLLSQKQILESYLRTLLTLAAYKYGDQNTNIVLFDRSKLEHTIDLESGNKFIVKITRYPGKSIAEMFASVSGVRISLAKATRYDATLRELISDLGDYLDFDDDWYTLFNISEDYLDQEVQDETIDSVVRKEFTYTKAAVTPEPEPEPTPEPTPPVVDEESGGVIIDDDIPLTIDENGDVVLPENSGITVDPDDIEEEDEPEPDGL